MTTKWTRNEAGAYVSDCGQCRVEPQYMGRTSVAGWLLRVRHPVDGTMVRSGSFDTLRVAKSNGERVIEYRKTEAK